MTTNGIKNYLIKHLAYKLLERLSKEKYKHRSVNGILFDLQRVKK